MVLSLKVELLTTCLLGFADALSILNLKLNRNFVKRGEDADSLSITNTKSSYTLSVGFGTPAQAVSMIVDTGSADTWISSADFQSSSSSTFNQNDTDFKIEYGDNSGASGSWASDVVDFGGGMKIDGNFAVASDVTGNASPILGLGLVQGESTVSRVTDDGTLIPTYDNIPKSLMDQGKILRMAYSLWLNAEDAESGELIFGGVDHEKYSGENLWIVPIVNDDSVPAARSPTTLSVMLHGMSIGDTHIASSLPVLLDSGTTLTYLPEDLADTIAAALGASSATDSGLYPASCNLGSQEVIFNLSGISIPMANVVIPGSGGSCYLGFAKNPKAQKYILGDTFLRGAYVTYDLEGLQVGLAPALANVTDSQLETISTGIPGSSAPLYSATAFTSGIASWTPESTSSPTSALPSTSSVTSSTMTSSTALSGSSSSPTTSSTTSVASPTSTSSSSLSSSSILQSTTTSSISSAPTSQEADSGSSASTAASASESLVSSVEISVSPVPSSSNATSVSTIAASSSTRSSSNTSVDISSTSQSNYLSNTSTSFTAILTSSSHESPSKISTTKSTVSTTSGVTSITRSSTTTSDRTNAGAVLTTKSMLWILSAVGLLI